VNLTRRCQNTGRRLGELEDLVEGGDDGPEEVPLLEQTRLKTRLA
jgi:hypothetical protein